MVSHIYLMMLYGDIGRPQSDRFVIDALYLIPDCNRTNIVFDYQLCGGIFNLNYGNSEFSLLINMGAIKPLTRPLPQPYPIPSPTRS